jgi:CheY-like chemotaxis protein
MLELRIGAKPEAAGFPWSEVLAIAPHLIWAGVLLIVLTWLGRDNLVELLRRVQKVGIAGLEVELRQTLEQAAKEQGRTLSGPDLDRVSKRLLRDAAIIKGARILWLDNTPNNNLAERRIFEMAGASVDTRTSIRSAEEALARRSYDLILSNIAHPGETETGVDFADRLAATENAPPVIFYVGHARKPAPASAFGITDRPDEFVHLVLDALARSRG